MGGTAESAFSTGRSWRRHGERQVDVLYTEPGYRTLSPPPGFLLCCLGFQRKAKAQLCFERQEVGPTCRGLQGWERCSDLREEGACVGKGALAPFICTAGWRVQVPPSKVLGQADGAGLHPSVNPASSSLAKAPWRAGQALDMHATRLPQCLHCHTGPPSAPRAASTPPSAPLYLPLLNVFAFCPSTCSSLSCHPSPLGPELPSSQGYSAPGGPLLLGTKVCLRLTQLPWK